MVHLASGECTTSNSPALIPRRRATSERASSSSVADISTDVANGNEERSTERESL